MHNIEIRRPHVTDIEELHEFFHTVITNAFAREGLADLVEDIEYEIETKRQCLKRDFDSNGKNQYFLIAVDNQHNNIVGTIEYAPARELVVKETNRALQGMNEVGTVFVHPDYQRRGISALLWNMIFLTFLNRGIEEFCLDSGYKNAQKIWQKKFGEPDYFLKAYWGEGHDHMIWKRRTEDMSIIF
jgi:GNAT superfamily N-acetyltransferase